MRFFRMRQDLALPNRLRLRDFDTDRGHKTFTKAEAEGLKDSTVLFMAGTGDEDCPDFLVNPVYLVSEKVKKVLDMYEDGLIFKKVRLIHQGAGRIEKYSHLVTNQLLVLDGSTRRYPNDLVERLVLNQGKIGGHHVFQLGDCKEEGVYVSLAVVESLLRRQIQGVYFEEVEVV